MSAATRPPSGTRDFLPRELLARRKIMRAIESAYEAAGFLPLETPSFERIETLMGKYGDEGDQLIFRILKRGDKLSATSLLAQLDPALARTLRTSDEEPDVPQGSVVSALPAVDALLDQNLLADHALRYDLTVPFARVVAAHRNDLPKHFKRYQMQPVWRADRPQRGRFREFLQCDVDYIGTESTIAEWEVLSAGGAALQAIGFPDAACRLNDRRILLALLETTGIPEPLHGPVLIALDKLDKIGSDGVRREWTALELSAASIASLEALTLVDATSGNQEVLARLTHAFADHEGGRAGVEALREILAHDAASPTGLDLRVDLSLVRGLSYYTGPIYELQLPGFPGSVGGGGRYDGLIGMFAGTRIPAVGLSLGFERLLVLLEERGDLRDEGPTVDVYATRMHTEADPLLLQTVRRLRDAGFRVALHPDGGPLKKQLKLAAASGARVALLLGPSEVETGTITVRDLETGTQAAFSSDDLLPHLQGNA